MFFGRIHHQALVQVEHQLAHLGETPQRTAAHVAGVEFVDLAVVEEGHLVQRLGHGVQARGG